jgi:hypothetical protein
MGRKAHCLKLQVSAPGLDAAACGFDANKPEGHFSKQPWKQTCFADFLPSTSPHLSYSLISAPMVANPPLAMTRFPVAFIILGVLTSHLAMGYAEDAALEMRPIVPNGTPGSVKLKLEDRSADNPPEELSCGKEVLLDSSSVKFAAAFFNPQRGWYVEVKFTEKGQKQLLEATTKWRGFQIGILSGGRLISAPYVNEPIAGGHLQISGRLTETTANALADVFMKGVKQDATDPATKRP